MRWSLAAALAAFAVPAAGQVCATPTMTCKCGAVVPCQGLTYDAVAASCAAACGGAQGGGSSGMPGGGGGFNQIQQAELQGAHDMGAAIGRGFIKLLTDEAPKPNARALERRRRREAQAAQGRADQARQERRNAELGKGALLGELHDDPPPDHSLDDLHREFDENRRDFQSAHELDRRIREGRAAEKPDATLVGDMPFKDDERRGGLEDLRREMRRSDEDGREARERDVKLREEQHAEYLRLKEGKPRPDAAAPSAAPDAKAKALSKPGAGDDKPSAGAEGLRKEFRRAGREGREFHERNLRLQKDEQAESERLKNAAP